MSFSEEFFRVGKELLKSLENALYKELSKQNEEINEICKLIDSAPHIHVYGKGRSGTAAVNLALRLSHFGYNVSFVGDVIKRRIEEDHVVILFSGSGATRDTVGVAHEAKKANAKIIAITSYKNSPLGKLADVTITLSGGLPKEKGWDYLRAQIGVPSLYGGGEFEIKAQFLQEILVNALGRYKNVSASEIAKRHERDEII